MQTNCALHYRLEMLGLHFSSGSYSDFFFKGPEKGQIWFKNTNVTSVDRTRVTSMTVCNSSTLLSEINNHPNHACIGVTSVSHATDGCTTDFHYEL